MAETGDFFELIAKVRAGDDEAAAELVRVYEPQIRRVIRVRLTSPGLRRQLDTLDVCQSVMGNFFARMALGQFEVDSPEQLVKLLAAMAKNRLLKHVEQQTAGKRDVRRLAADDAGHAAAAGREASPSRIVAARELLGEFRDRLTDKERQLADYRAEGLTWPEIAAKMGGNVDALRICLNRAVDRVGEELGLESTDND